MAFEITKPQDEIRLTPAERERLDAIENEALRWREEYLENKAKNSEQPEDIELDTTDE